VKSTLITRTLTAIFFVVIILAALLLHHIVFCLVFYLFMLAALAETYKMLGNQHQKAQVGFGLIAGSIIFILAHLVSRDIAGIGIYLLVVPLFMAFFLIEIFKKNAAKHRSVELTMFGIIYVTIPFAMFNFLGTSDIWLSDSKNFFLIGFFLILWANDTGAYLIGSLAGKHPFAENISPNKTIEGTLGGVVVAALAAFLLSQFSSSISFLSWLALGVIIAVSGTYGDLAESMFKRRAGVKDSGNIMPGHGGVLDRFDSFIFAVPAAFTYIQILELF
jgi:phosphatidate cytidylyltransferase